MFLSTLTGHWLGRCWLRLVHTHSMTTPKQTMPVATWWSSTLTVTHHSRSSGIPPLLKNGALPPIHLLVTPMKAPLPCCSLAIDLDTPTQHRGAYWLIVNRLLAELGLKELKDNCGQKPERLLWQYKCHCSDKSRCRSAGFSAS